MVNFSSGALTFNPSDNCQYTTLIFVSEKNYRKIDKIFKLHRIKFYHFGPCGDIFTYEAFSAFV